MASHMQFYAVIVLLFIATSAYHLDVITCWEQNKEDPTGFRDPIMSDPTSDACVANPQMCSEYQSHFGGVGDVCESDNRNNLEQNMCYFNVIFGANLNTEKTWSYKCWASSMCPLGPGVEGCLLTDKRISCCCNGDLCNGQELFRKYAEYGKPEMYSRTLDMTEILSIDTGGVRCDYSPGSTKRKGTTTVVYGV